MLCWTRLTRLTLASVALASASVALVPAALPAAAGDPSPPLTPACAWTANSVHTSNRSSPDSSAIYYGLPIPIQPGLQITIHGRFPDARYASFHAYQPGGGLFTVNGVNSWLTDYQIQPDPGSINPWQGPVSGTHQGKDDQHFTLTLSSDVTPGQASTLPLAPAGVTSGTGNLSYRVYLPVGNNFAQVPLPAVTFTLNGESVQVPACAPAASSTSR